MKKFFVTGISAIAVAAAALVIVPSVASAAADFYYYHGKKIYRHPAATAATPAPAPTTAHGPDLIVLADQTVVTVNPKGCDQNEDLLTGTVAIKNRGDAQAERLIVEPIVSIWIPEMLDLKDDKLVPNALTPNGIFTTDFHVGKGKIKNGRGLIGHRKVYIMADPYNKIPKATTLDNLLVRDVVFACK